MSTAVITSDSSLDHLTGNGHPEKPDRVSSVIDTLKREKNLIWDKTKKFDETFLEITHSSNYVSEIKKSFPKEGLSFLDGDTIISPGSKNATVDAVGSIISAIDGIENKNFNNAFCAVRPPGHHAEKEKAMGFCIYNNIAVGAQYLITKYKYKKIAIIDFDVHHGNGTQDIFYENEKVLYISTHQYPYYPGSGNENEKGKYNNVLNIPLPAGTTSDEYLNAYNHVIKKLIEISDKNDTPIWIGVSKVIYDLYASLFGLFQLFYYKENLQVYTICTAILKQSNTINLALPEFKCKIKKAIRRVGGTGLGGSIVTRLSLRARRQACF